MYINFWYPMASSEEVADGPIQVTALGQPFALFRDSHGNAHWLADTGVHRGGALGTGKLKGDCIEWTYQGWHIDLEHPDRTSARKVYAIPSPGRRDTVNWILDTVPLMAPA